MRTLIFFFIGIFIGLWFGNAKADELTGRQLIISTTQMVVARVQCGVPIDWDYIDGMVYKIAEEQKVDPAEAASFIGKTSKLVVLELKKQGKLLQFCKDAHDIYDKAVNKGTAL